MYGMPQRHGIIDIFEMPVHANFTAKNRPEISVNSTLTKQKKNH